MFDFHSNRQHYFNMQVDNCKKYVLPFIEQKIKVEKNMRVLEVGCGEAGVLKPFIDRGCIGVGVEFDLPRVELGKQFLKDEVENKKMFFVAKDIYKTSVEELGGKFDIIIFKDVIEHIHNQSKMLKELQRFLMPNGCVFFGFPPWQMPFGGHQQICKSSFLSKLPYFHLLPLPLYKFILKRKGENVAEMLEIRETKISIEKFERISSQTGFNIIHKTHFLINPIYEYKFKLKARKQFFLIKHIPWIRNFFTTCVYYLITPKNISH